MPHAGVANITLLLQVGLYCPSGISVPLFAVGNMARPIFFSRFRSSVSVSGRLELPPLTLVIFVLTFVCNASTPIALDADDSPGEVKTFPKRNWTVFAGTGDASSPVAIKPADPKTVALRNVYGIETKGKSILLSTVDDHSIWQMDRAGKHVLRIAGTGQLGYEGDDGLASSATFNAPHEIRVDRRGNVYIADTRNHCIRMIHWDTGIVETIAGDGEPGYRGDNGPGEKARFNQPHSIVLDGKGGLLVADTKNHRVRRIDLSTRFVTTVCGDGKGKLPVDGQLASEVSVHGPRSMAVSEKAYWLVLREGNSVWRIDHADGKIYHVAGTGKKGYDGDGGDARKATFRGPKGIAVDSDGNLLVVDTENHALRIIDRETSLIRTAAISQKLKRPHGTAVLQRPGKADAYLLSDSENHRVLIGTAP